MPVERYFQGPGSCQGCTVTGWLLLIFGDPQCQLDVVSDSRPNLSKHLHWVDASKHLSALLEQASSFHLGEDLGTGCSLQRDRRTMPALALSTQSSPPKPPSQARAP